MIAIFRRKTLHFFGNKCASLPISLLTKLSDIWFGLAGDLKIGVLQGHGDRHLTRDREIIPKKVKIGNKRGDKVNIYPYFTLMKS